MSKRKPRSRKAAASSSRASGRRVGPLWWGAGILALGWIAFDANRPAVERHVPQLAALRLPWQAPEAPHARREPAPQRTVQRPPVSRPASPSAAEAGRPPETRQAALRPAAVIPPATSALPEARPARPAAAPAAGIPAASGNAPAAAAPGPAGSDLVTRGPTPLRRAPQAGAPVWMVLDAGRPLRVTRREAGFARVESGIFTGWVEAAALPEAARRPAPAGTMPTLAATEARRAGPVPAASVPGAAR